MAPGSHNRLYYDLKAKGWFVAVNRTVHTWPGSTKASQRSTAAFQVAPDGSIICGVACIADGSITPLPPPGAQVGGDGLIYDANGNNIAWYADGNDGNGAWLILIGNVQSAPYEDDLSPYLTAADFGNNIAPWFYSFALPIDIPVGAFLARFGGRFAGRLAVTAVGRFMAMVKAAVGAGAFTEKTSFAVNAELRALGFTDAPFPAASKVLDFFTNDAFNSAFSGGNQMVRAVTKDDVLDGPWWTTLSSITDAQGRLLPANEIADRLRLNYIPTNLILGGRANANTELLMGIVGPQTYANGGAIQFFVKSGRIIGESNVPIP